jgi:hypothetical protein
MSTMIGLLSLLSGCDTPPPSLPTPPPAAELPEPKLPEPKLPEPKLSESQPPAPSHTEGNPPGWCREGSFAAEGDGFRILKVTTAADRLHFLKDTDGCPTAGDCQRKAYLVPGDEVVVNRSIGGHACAWYTAEGGNATEGGNVTVGWLPDDELSASVPAVGSWEGEWSYASNTITIQRGADGVLVASGLALWLGLGVTPHIGEFEETPLGSVYRGLHSLTPYEGCTVSLRQLGSWLIVDDNLGCGGLNVTFRGLYRR